MTGSAYGGPQGAAKRLGIGQRQEVDESGFVFQHGDTIAIGDQTEGLAAIAQPVPAAAESRQAEPQRAQQRTQLRPFLQINFPDATRSQALQCDQPGTEPRIYADRLRVERHARAPDAPGQEEIKHIQQQQRPEQGAAGEPCGCAHVQHARAQYRKQYRARHENQECEPAQRAGAVAGERQDLGALRIGHVRLRAWIVC